MKDRIIKVENVSEYAAIISLLFNYGYYHYDDKVFKELTEEWDTKNDYPWVCVDHLNKSFCGFVKRFLSDEKDYLTFAEGLAFLTDDLKTEKIDIGEYKNCVYNKKQVSVGCQTIPFETVEKLYNGMKSLKN
jgi:hypothetical protein